MGNGGTQLVAFGTDAADSALAIAVDELNERIAIAGFTEVLNENDQPVRDVAVARLQGLPGVDIFVDGFEEGQTEAHSPQSRSPQSR